MEGVNVPGAINQYPVGSGVILTVKDIHSSTKGIVGVKLVSFAS